MFMSILPRTTRTYTGCTPLWIIQLNRGSIVCISRISGIHPWYSPDLIMMNCFVFPRNVVIFTIVNAFLWQSACVWQMKLNCRCLSTRKSMSVIKRNRSQVGPRKNSIKLLSAHSLVKIVVVELLTWSHKTWQNCLWKSC